MFNAESIIIEMPLHLESLCPFFTFWIFLKSFPMYFFVFTCLCCGFLAICGVRPSFKILLTNESQHATHLILQNAAH